MTQHESEGANLSGLFANGYRQKASANNSTIEWSDSVLQRAQLIASPSLGKTISTLIGTPVIGSGKEKIVYPYGKNSIIALYKYPHKPMAVIKEEFYRRKLAHVIAPDSIPNIHFASVSPPLLVVDRVENLRSSDSTTDPIFDQAGVSAILDIEAAGFTINDPADDNFALDSSGNAMYVDSLSECTWDVAQSMQTIAKLPLERQALAGRFVSRLLTVGDPDYRTIQ